MRIWYMEEEKRIATYHNLSVFDLIVQILQIFLWDVFSIVDPSVVAQKLSPAKQKRRLSLSIHTRRINWWWNVLGHFLALRDARVVQIGVQQDGREGQDIGGVCVGERPADAQIFEQMAREGLHDTVDALGLTGEFELAQKHPQRRIKTGVLAFYQMRKKNIKLA